MRRKLCFISLILIIIVAFSVHGPWDFLGANAKADACKALTEGTHVQATGTVSRKEIKNNQTLYYIDCGSKNLSFIFKFDSDYIPNKSKLNIEGDIAHFSHGTNEGSFDMQKYYQSMGYYFELTNVRINSIECSKIISKDLLYLLSKRLLNVYQAVLPGEEAGFLSSIAIGNKSDLAKELRSIFQLVGIAHILAVSGLHVSVVCMGLYKLLRKCGLTFIVSAIFSGTIAVAYGLLTGGSLSSIRAIGMFLIFIVGDILGEAYDTLTALALMADILVIQNPLVIENSSFIFSFGAVLGIQLISVPLSRNYKGIKQTIIFALSINIAMLPLVTNLYYETPIFSVLLNLIVLPFMPILLGLGLLGGFLGLLWMPSAVVLLTPCHFIIYGYELLADFILKLPLSRMVVGYRPLWQVALYYLLVLAFVYIPVKKSFLTILMALVSMQLFWITPRNGSFEVDILDVGQGDGSYINSGDGVKFFIDGGSSSIEKVGQYTIEPFLKYKGAGCIDYWFVSHLDEDHVSGLKYMLEHNYKIKNIVLYEGILKDEKYQDLLSLAKSNDTKIIYMKKGDIIGTKHLRFKCINVDLMVADANESSLCLMVEYDTNNDDQLEFSGFFGGDIGASQERLIASSWKLSHVNMLKVSHHGSKYSSDEVFLSSLSPDVAVISCAKRNMYGHPAAEAVNRLEKHSKEIYYTMNSGRIRINSKGVEGYIGEVVEIIQ